jgi:hypothetical protein
VAMALANSSRPSAALAVGDATVATAASTASAVAYATDRRSFTGGIDTIAPLLRQLDHDNINHSRNTVNFGNNCASVGNRLGR